MDGVGIVLSEIGQTDRDRYCIISSICGALKKKAKLLEIEASVVASRSWSAEKSGDVAQTTDWTDASRRPDPHSTVTIVNNPV